nr:RNA-directed DNA polymerase, eukaryota, reverse transcriptase zinc-binding domain protein [Tanacetum cinerariifolium]
MNWKVIFRTKRLSGRCGIDKSSGPDGVTFGFIRRYFSLIENDVVAAVQHFFSSGNFPKGCNASFIALIPKIPDAKLVKDFQSAFVADRQILDGDILNRFGFGAKWCGWIQECLRSSRVSVLVNGSSTEEFKFYKGLKQGDKLSPFLFILVIESLHLPFKRVEDAGMFNGIKFNSSMTLSHMFYANDAIFMGQWSKRNIDTLMYMLKCFERASGLSINFSKSKLMGLAVSIEKVEEVTRHIGCGILNTLFSFSGSKVRGCMSRIKSWDEVIDKMVNRLSKWKMKTMSIGGRLTLLKSVFGSMPIYHMSIFKVPMLVLQRMESIRCHFFNDNDLDSKRSIWVSWNKVLTSKEKEGLGVSSLFALNRALMLKWVWRIFNQSDSLWVRVIHAIHRLDGRIGRAGNVGYTSIWCDIIKEMDRMPRSGIKSKQWDHLLDSLEGVMLNPSKNWWSWDLNGSGEFSVASTRKYIDKNRLPDISSKTRWIKEVPIKVNVHAWKVRINGLPTRWNISRRDIKPANILLDVNMVAKIADFGTVKNMKDNNNSPMKGKFKTDVYSFGVIILEMLTGVKAVEDGHPHISSVEFDMTDLDALNYFLGISATRSSTGLFLSQKTYACELLEHANMVNCNPLRTPVDTDSKLGPEGVAICLYMHDPREPHFAALKRILRYVRGTMDFGLQLYASAITSLVGYTDADWAGCLST